MPDLFTKQNESQGRDRRLSSDDMPVAAQDPASSAPQPAQPVSLEPTSPESASLAPDAEPAKQSRFAQASAKLQTIKGKMSNVHNMKLFDAFCENPARVYFETQEPDEQVLLFLRKSQWLNLPWILATIGLALVPFVLFLFRSQLTTFSPPFAYFVVLIPFYYIGVTTFAFVNFITWYYNAGLITSKRVIDIDFHQLVYKEIDETKLALVQDVSYQQVGVFQNLLGFGHVLIQTAGTIDNFEFFQLPKPARVVEVVENLIGGKRFYEP